MLWTVHHLWPSGDRLFFNCYLHHSSLVRRNGYVAANIILIRESVTQGYPLDMVAYEIKTLPLIKHLK